MTARRTRRAELAGPGNQYSAGFSRPMIHAPTVNPNQKMSHNSSTPIHTLGVSCGFELPHGTLLLLFSFQFVERVCNHRTMSAARSALVAPLLHPGNFSKMPKSCFIGRASSCACASVHVLIFSVSSTPSSILAYPYMLDGGWRFCHAPFWHHVQRFLFGPLSHRAPRDGLLLGVVCRGSSVANCVTTCNSRSTFRCNWLRSYAARNALLSSSS